MRKLNVAVVTFLALPLFSSAATLPTEDEVKGIQVLCGAGQIQSALVKVNVDAAIKSWRNAAGNASVEVAKSDLAGALGQVRNDVNLAPVYRVYIDCVKDTIQQFIDREANEPRQISSAGRSEALLRSKYVSDDAIWKAGCDEARLNAEPELISMCPQGKISIVNVTCPQVSGSPRTYTAALTALCQYQ